MIYQNAGTENTRNQFSNAIKELQCGKLLRKANITKSCGAPAFEVFQFLLLLVFQGKNLFRFLCRKFTQPDGNTAHFTVQGIALFIFKIHAAVPFVF